LEGAIEAELLTQSGNLRVDDWDSYECVLNRRTVSIFVNLSAIRRAPSPDKPWLVRILARNLATRCAAQYAKTAFPELQNRVLAALAADALACEFVGSIDAGASRELFFYSMSTEAVERGVETIGVALEGCAIQCRSERDSQWRHYREVLYPGTIEMQRIRNRRVLEQLQRRGDDHSVPRPVDHDLYFRTRPGSADFIRAATKQGFQSGFEPTACISDRRMHPFRVNVVRRDPVTPEHIADVALELMMLATRFDGEYDSWGCEVCTAASGRGPRGYFGSSTPPKWSVREASKEEEFDPGDLH
jgi:regulator of RNase E activity RraB